jgi:hypothetical protein
VDGSCKNGNETSVDDDDDDEEEEFPVSRIIAVNTLNFITNLELNYLSILLTSVLNVSYQGIY